MKKIVFFISVILISSLCFSQSGKDEFRTILGDDFKVSGFGGPDMGFSTVNGKFAHFMGGGGGAIINDRFFFGGFGTGMTNTVESLQFGYGGFWLGYIFAGNEALHPVFYTKLGWGGVSEENEGARENCFVVAPTLELEMNITRFFRIGVGANYRYVAGIDNINSLNSQDFSGPGAVLSFRFGWF